MNKQGKGEKLLFLCSIVVCIWMLTEQTVFAMHIMEGYLPVIPCLVWTAVSLPFVAAGLFQIRRLLAHDKRAVTMLAMSSAFIFVISSLKIPSVTGSCSHMTGMGLGAILLGPVSVCVLGVIVLLFQAVLLAHGGITTLGANVFSMAIAGPMLAYFGFRLCRRWKLNRRISIFLAAFLGDIFTYCITSLQLGMAYPSQNGGVTASIGKFLLIFAPTQLPLAVSEGILTVIILIALETYAVPELNTIGYRAD